MDRLPSAVFHCQAPVVAMGLHCQTPVVAMGLHCQTPVVAMGLHCQTPVVAMGLHCQGLFVAVTFLWVVSLLTAFPLLKLVDVVHIALLVSCGHTSPTS